MDVQKTNQKTKNKRFVWLTALLCIGCCSIPFILALGLGFSTVAGLAIYFESAALGILVIAAGFFVYSRHKQKQQTQGSSCSVDCGCKNEA